MISIQQKIVGYSVVESTAAAQPEPGVAPAALTVRPETLEGRTYKIKTPLSESALYITINHFEFDGQLRPFEIFINSKDMKHFQWVVALTRLISAVFRQGGSVNFLIDELRSVVDPQGGYFAKGRYVASLVSLIGDVIEQHLTHLGLFARDTSLQEAAVAMVKEKQKPESSDGKMLCEKCHEVAVVMDGGCSVCLSCSDSRCT